MTVDPTDAVGVARRILAELNDLITGTARAVTDSQPNMNAEAAAAVNLYAQGELSARVAVAPVTALASRLVALVHEEDRPDELECLIAARDWYWTACILRGSKGDLPDDADACALIAAAAHVGVAFTVLAGAVT